MEEQPAAWLHRLVEAVAGSMTADSPMGPLGHRHRREEACWEVDVYPTPIELVGGAADGEVVVPGFTLDVDELRAAFDRIETLEWISLGFPHDEGPRLVVEGIFQGQEVFLQVLTQHTLNRPGVERALAGVLGQQLHDQLLQPLGAVDPLRSDALGLAVQMLLPHLRKVRTHERR